MNERNRTSGQEGDLTMKIGISGTTAERAEQAARYGFDFMEIPLGKVRDLDQKTLTEIAARAKAAGVPIESAHGFFTPDVVLYGDRSVEEAVLAYCTKNYEISKLLGVKICVIGSGKARSVPEGMEKAEAETRFAALLGKMADRAMDFGISLAVEPLRYKETDLVNTLTDGIRIKRMADRKNVGCLVDFFHFFCNGENLADLDQLEPGELIHTHLARPNDDRCAPKAEDAPTLAKWAAKLKEIGYDRRVALECGWKPEFEDVAAEAAEQMRVFR